MSSFSKGKGLGWNIDREPIAARASKGTIRKSVDRLLSQGYLKEIIIEKGRKKVPNYELSDKGRLYHNDLVDIFPIIEFLPDFYTHIMCPNCSNDEKIQCFEERKIDLINVIKKYDYTDTARILADKILDLFEIPNQLEEYLFWFIMSKFSIKQLNTKYKNVYEIMH